jgi:hypothetical protein
LDPDNSELWRTADSSKVTAHFSKANVSVNSHSLVLEFSSYDDDELKYYTRVFETGTSSRSRFEIGTGISAPINSSQFSLTNSPATNGGTSINLTNVSTAGIFADGTAAGFENVRTFWCYLTNNCIIWATTNSLTFDSGFGTTYNNQSLYKGPFIVAQYTRFDHHNNAFNQIRPVIYYNFEKTGGLTVADLTSTRNTGFTSNDTTLPFRCINFVEAESQSTGFPVVFHPYVGLTMGGKSNNFMSLDSRTAGAATTSTAASFAGPFRTNLSARRPTADAVASGFGLVSMGWEELFRGNHGGNVSDRSKFYIFNAEYAPGDEFVLDGTTWMIWPTFQGFASRLGLAIPKE